MLSRVSGLSGLQYKEITREYAAMSVTALKARPGTPAYRALRDLLQGISMSWIWAALAVQDIKSRYRGSLLGPLWVTASTTLLVIGMGVIFSRAFSSDP